MKAKNKSQKTYCNALVNGVSMINTNPGCLSRCIQVVKMSCVWPEVSKYILLVKIDLKTSCW